MTEMRTIEVERGADVEDSKLVFRQIVFRRADRVKLEERVLTFNPERCSGCQFCVYACPVSAIEFAGYEMLVAGMPLIIDHTSCCFCGICYALCPERAFDFSTSSVTGFEFRLAGGARKLENCVGCRVCYEVCPAGAVRLEVKTVDEFHKREPETRREGKLSIDPEKCKLCGKCTLFCDALVAAKKDVTPSNPAPFSEILLREDRCDYCGLCEYVCPNGAITVTAAGAEVAETVVEITNEAMKEITKVEITDKCVECGICVKACPYEAVELKRSFSGEIRVKWKRLERVCDWESCRLCINVCKSNAWYVEEGKLKLEPELCRFCRACMYACPEELIEVELSDVSVECGWEGWRKAVERVIGERRAGVGRKIGALEGFKTGAGVEMEGKGGGEGLKCFEERFEERLEKKEEEELKAEKRVDRRVVVLEEVLKNTAYRRLFELNPEKFLRVLKRNEG